MTRSSFWKALALAAVAVVFAVLLGPALVTEAAPSTGYVEVCKQSDGSDLPASFRFTVADQTVEVPVGACSAPLAVTAGVVTVTEEAVAGVGVLSIVALPADRLVSSSTATRSAQVTVVAGGTAAQTVVTFTNRSEVGVLSICKAAGSGVSPGTNFTFLAGGRAIAVPAGQCAPGGTYPYGSNITISEVPSPGTRVAAISVVPDVRMLGAPNLTDGTVTVTIGPAVTGVTFTNEAVPLGYLQICKQADAGSLSGTFTFTVAGQTVDVPVGLCSPVLRVPEGVVTVTESLRGDAVVTGITTSPGSRLVGANLTTRSAEVMIVAGDITRMATVTFVNRSQVGQVKLCKVAGAGVMLGASFAFTVGGQPITVPAGSCVVAGSFPLGSVVTVTETVPSGMQVAAIRVEPPERSTSTPNPRLGTASITVGSGFTEIFFTNQSVQVQTTTTTPSATSTSTSSTIPLTTTSTIPVVSTIPPTTTSTIPVVSTIPPTTTSTIPVVSTIPPTTTSTIPVVSTIPPTTTSTIPVVSTIPLTTTSTIPVVSTIPLTTTSTTPVVSTIPLSTTSTIPVVSTSTSSSTSTTSGVQATTSTTSAVTTTSSTTSKQSTTTSSVATTVPNTSTTTTLQSSTTTTVIERATIPVTAVRLALTGSGTWVLTALALVALAVGATLLCLSVVVENWEDCRSVRDGRRHSRGRLRRSDLSSARRLPGGASTDARRRVRHRLM